jgi:diguanylate cyclase (GGDEF)-like protein
MQYLSLILNLIFFLTILYLVAALKKSRKKEKDLAGTDYLTGVANGKHFTSAIQMEINRSLRYHHPFTMVCIDVDHLKNVNEDFGYSIGNALLKVLAETLKKNIRNTDTLARLGGDEFGLILPETRYESAQFVLRRIQKNLLEMIEKNGWSVTLSIGAITFATPPAHVDAVLWRANQLLFAAKFAEKNKIKHELWEEPPIQLRSDA